MDTQSAFGVSSEKERALHIQRAQGKGRLRNSLGLPASQPHPLAKLGACLSFVSAVQQDMYFCHFQKAATEKASEVLWMAMHQIASACTCCTLF